MEFMKKTLHRHKWVFSGGEAISGLFKDGKALHFTCSCGLQKYDDGKKKIIFSLYNQA